MEAFIDMMASLAGVFISGVIAFWLLVILSALGFLVTIYPLYLIFR